LDTPFVPLFMCNLHRAESIVRRYIVSLSLDECTNQSLLSMQLTPALRDSLKLVYYPGDGCHTLTSTISNLYWIGGSCGRCGFATRAEVAGFMGHSQMRALAPLSRFVSSDYMANQWLAESVHGRMAAECARLALDHLAPRPHWTAGSLYSGAFDALITGFVDCGVRIERVFAADVVPEKLRVLSSAFSPHMCFTTAHEASRRCPHVDILTASPSCHEVSRARDLLDGGEDLPSEAVVEYTHAIVETICRAAPLVVVIEQTNGLRTHHPALYLEFNRALGSLPYYWFPSELDARTDLGASHTRTRLLWVGIRVDVCVFRLPQPSPVGLPTP